MEWIPCTDKDKIKEWAGILRRGRLNWPHLREAVGIPKGYSHFYPMMLGYAQYNCHRMPERKPQKITWR